MPALRDWESGGQELEYITSRQEKTKRCTKLDKNVVQRYVKARQRRNKTATENCLLLRDLFIRDYFLFRWPFPHYIRNYICNYEASVEEKLKAVWRTKDKGVCTTAFIWVTSGVSQIDFKVMANWPSSCEGLQKLLPSSFSSHLQFYW